MQRQMKQIAIAAKNIYNMTCYQNRLTTNSLQVLQTQIDNMQAALDLAAKEAIKQEEQDDAYDRQEAYPITNEPWD